MSDVIVIGVAGGTGSGKTTLVKALVNRFGDNISVLSHDNYYKRHDEMSYEERTHLNYDCPDAFDTDMMIDHLRMLKNGQAIDCPTYDYTIHNRAEEVLHIEPRRVIVVEGIMIFVNKTLCDEMNIRIFVDADADVRLCRRIRRDVKKRGRSDRLRHRPVSDHRSSPCTSSLRGAQQEKRATSSSPRAVRTSSRWK